MRGPLRSTLIFLGLLGLGASVPSRAGTVTLTFDTFQNGEAIGDYYNGGMGSGVMGGVGSGPGPNDGIVFGPNAYVYNSNAAGTQANFANNPSSPGVMVVTDGSNNKVNLNAVMNVAGGFSSALSFYYSAAYTDSAGSVTIYDGGGGAGNVLATMVLPQTPPLPPGSPAFNNWQVVSLNFSGVAKSVVFSGSNNSITFDNVSLGASPIPEPSSLVLSGLGALAVAGLAARRRAA